MCVDVREGVELSEWAQQNHCRSARRMWICGARRCEVGRGEHRRGKSGEDTMERTRGGEEEEEEGLLTGGLPLSLSSSSSSSSPSPYLGGLGSFCDYALTRAS